MALLSTVPRSRVEDLCVDPTSIRVTKKVGASWERVGRRAAPPEQACVSSLDGVCAAEQLAGVLGDTVSRRVERGEDACVVLYPFEERAAASQSVECVAAAILEKLQHHLRALATDADAARKLRQYQEEEQLSTEELLRKRKEAPFATPPPPSPSPSAAAPAASAAVDEARRQERRRATIASLHSRRSSFKRAQLPRGSFVVRPSSAAGLRGAAAASAASSSAAAAAAAGGGLESLRHQRRLRRSSREKLREEVTLQRSLTDYMLHRGSATPAPTTPTPTLTPGGGRFHAFGDEVASEGEGEAAATPGCRSAQQHPQQRHASGGRRSSYRGVAYAEPPAPTGMTALAVEQGHSGRTLVPHFPPPPRGVGEAEDWRAHPHLKLSGLRNLGCAGGRVGVELWVCTSVTTRKQTIVQLMGAGMEMLQVVLHQDLSQEFAPGVLYVKLRDALYNELVVQADTTDLLANGRWHHLLVRGIDPEDDKLEIAVDGVRLRTRVGVHTCPYKFDGWGAAGAEPAFGCLGGDGGHRGGDVSMRMYPFSGQMAECVVWAGDRVLHHFPLRGAGGGSDDTQAGGGGRCVPCGSVAFEPAPFPETSLLFEGDGYVNCGAPSELGELLGQAVTLDLWFRVPKGEDEPMCLLGVTDPSLRRQRLQVSVNADEDGKPCPGCLMFCIADSRGATMTAAVHAGANDGEWHRLLWAICNASAHSVRVELDSHTQDVRMGRLEAPSEFTPFTTFLAIGAHNNRGEPQEFLKGSVKGVKVWAGKGRARRLLCYWRLNEGPGASIFMDSTGYGNNGVAGRVPASCAAEDRAARGGAASLAARRRASSSAARLRRASDLSFRYLRWTAGRQPAVSDLEAEQDQARQTLLQRVAESGGRDCAVRLCVLCVTARSSGGGGGGGGGDAVDGSGAYVEAVLDCLHEEDVDVASMKMGGGGGGDGVWRGQWAADTACDDEGHGHGAAGGGGGGIPERCWEDVTPTTLPLALERAGRYLALQRTQGHQVLALRAGDARVTVVQLLGRSATHRVSVSGSGELQWTGPVRLAGTSARVRHVLVKGMAAVDAFFQRNGTGTLTKHPPPLQDSVLAHLLYVQKRRQSAPFLERSSSSSSTTAAATPFPTDADNQIPRGGSVRRGGEGAVRPSSPCIVVFLPETFEHVQAASLLTKAFRLGEEQQAAVLVQKTWKGHHSKELVERRRVENAERAEKLVRACVLEHQNLSVLALRSFDRWRAFVGR